MKQNNLTDISYKLPSQDYENIFSVFTDVDNFYYYNILRAVNFPEDLDPNSYSKYVVITNDTWPLIAWKWYRDIRLWWVVCAANQITNPVEHPKAGTILKIINPTIVKNLLYVIQRI